MTGINIKNIYKITFVIIGTIIGAGFASGQEIYTFFNKYGFNGFIGICISILLMSYIIYKTFKIVLKNNINNYEEFVKNIMPQRLKKNKILMYTINNIINIFLLICFNIMVAGFATYFIQELNISKWLGAILIAVLSFVTLSKNIDGVIKINTYLIPIIVILISFLGINKIEYVSIVSENYNNSMYWILSSILYASYNSITLIPILISLKNKINARKQSIIISICVGIIMLTLSIIIFLLMNTFINEIQGIEIPLVYIASSLGKMFKYIYGIVILNAIFTTAIGCGYGFLSNVTKKRKIYMLWAGTMCLAAILIGQIGFSSLINLLYPIFGYLGIIQIIFLIIAKTP